MDPELLPGYGSGINHSGSTTLEKTTGIKITTIYINRALTGILKSVTLRSKKSFAFEPSKLRGSATKKVFELI